MSVLVNRGRQTIISPRGPITTRGGLCIKAKHPWEDAVWLGGWLTSPPLSWGGRWGDRPTAGAPRTCWGTLGKQQALQCSSPVRRSPRRCRWWRCCWSCPVEEHFSFSVSRCRGNSERRARWEPWAKLCKHFRSTPLLLHHHYSWILAFSQRRRYLCFFQPMSRAHTAHSLRAALWSSGSVCRTWRTRCMVFFFPSNSR